MNFICIRATVWIAEKEWKQNVNSPVRMNGINDRQTKNKNFWTLFTGIRLLFGSAPRYHVRYESHIKVFIFYYALQNNTISENDVIFPSGKWSKWPFAMRCVQQWNDEKNYKSYHIYISLFSLLLMKLTVDFCIVSANKNCLQKSRWKSPQIVVDAVVVNGKYTFH